MIIRKKRNELGRNSNIEAYFASLEQILRFVNDEKSYSDKVLLLDYYMRVIKQDVIADNLSNMITPSYVLLSDGEKKQQNLPKSLFFQCYYTKSGERFLYKDFPDIEVDIASTDVLTYVTDNKKISENLKEMKDWTPPVIGSSIYIPYLDLCVILSSGHHQTAVRKLYKKHCKFTSKVLDITKSFDDVYTDGECWFHKYNSQDTELVNEYRISILFSLAKLKYFFESNADYEKIDEYISFKNEKISLEKKS
jgi:hypothetical protein